MSRPYLHRSTSPHPHPPPPPLPIPVSTCGVSKKNCDLFMSSAQLSLGNADIALDCSCRLNSVDDDEDPIPPTLHASPLLPSIASHRHLHCHHQPAPSLSPHSPFPTPHPLGRWGQSGQTSRAVPCRNCCKSLGHLHLLQSFNSRITCRISGSIPPVSQCPFPLFCPL